MSNNLKKNIYTVVLILTYILTLIQIIYFHTIKISLIFLTILTLIFIINIFIKQKFKFWISDLVLNITLFIIYIFFYNFLDLDYEFYKNPFLYTTIYAILNLLIRINKSKKIVFDFKILLFVLNLYLYNIFNSNRFTNQFFTYYLYLDTIFIFGLTLITGFIFIRHYYLKKQKNLFITHIILTYLNIFLKFFTVKAIHLHLSFYLINLVALLLLIPTTLKLTKNIINKNEVSNESK